MKIKKIITITLLVAVLIVLALSSRFVLYRHKDRTVTFPNGAVVHVKLADVRRIYDDRIRVKLDIVETRKTGERLLVPDIEITRPQAVIIPTSSPGIENGLGKLTRFGEYFTIPAVQDGATRSNTYFDLKQGTRTVDISQNLYYLKKDDLVHIELPLSVGSVRQKESARVEILDIGKGRNYARNEWRPICGDFTERPSDTLYVRVKQTDPDGPLIPWDEASVSQLDLDSCVAELLDRKGHAVTMSGNYVAYRDCRESKTNLTDLNPPIERLRRQIISFVTLGHVRITGGPGCSWTMSTPGNGEWIYTFKVKDPSKYSKIRIKYVLPPKPKDRIIVRFKNVPI